MADIWRSGPFDDRIVYRGRLPLPYQQRLSADYEIRWLQCTCGWDL